MGETASLPLFLISVIAISVTGVMMPGPVTAVTIAKGAKRKEAGALIAVGHGLIEIPLILLIYFGLAHFFVIPAVKISVGLAGGVVLIWMAWNMFRTRPSIFDEQKEMAHSSVITGLVTTAANPYFFVWWATVGVVLLASAGEFGSTGVVAMSAVHWLCDCAWLFLISWLVFKSKPLWTERVNRVVFGVCSVIMAGFGAWFIYSSIELAVVA
ncbi:MAG: LysE family transporter [Chloroflexota bacterium]|nr:LysE family transporter [Chloroflexota bacterium]